MAVAFILLLVAVASVLFHIFSPWWWTPIASNWSYIDDTITITFWITGAVFFAVVAFMAYCVFRFRHKEGRRAAYNPENKKLEWWLTHRDRDRRRSHVGARLVCLAPVRHGSGRCDRDRGHGPAVAMELPPSRKGRPAGHIRCPQRQLRQPIGLESRRSARARRRRHRKRRLAPAGREAGQGFAPLDRRPARFLCARVPGQDGYGAGHRSPISGSRPPEPEHSRFSARSYAAPRTRRCAARSSSRRRANITRGWRSSRRSRELSGAARRQRRRRTRSGGE